MKKLRKWAAALERLADRINPPLTESERAGDRLTRERGW